MTREMLIKKIRLKARQDRLKRKDLRFLDAMGFLVAKGFLRANYAVRPLPNKRIRIEDAIWAGKNVEPRILEVLPAAVLRLGKHFDLDPVLHKQLAGVVEQLRRSEKTGDAFCGIAYDKIRTWAELPLRDKRVKGASDKKVLKTFRLDRKLIGNLKKAASLKGCTETEILEGLLLKLKAV